MGDLFLHGRRLILAEVRAPRGNLTSSPVRARLGILKHRLTTPSFPLVLFGFTPQSEISCPATGASNLRWLHRSGRRILAATDAPPPMLVFGLSFNKISMRL
uniref:Uncharacterized protein n=1 Tax=Oryza meridionalis TaxID=40149 RepID=A0A0E0EZQ1_9ORYZ